MQRIGSWLFGVIVAQGLTLALLARAPQLQHGRLDLDHRRHAGHLGLPGDRLALLLLACQSLPPAAFPAADLLLAGATIWFAGGIVDAISAHEFKVTSIWAGVWISLGPHLADTIYGAVFTATDERLYNQFVTRPLRRTFRHAARSSVPGTLFLEIDGLAGPILEQAVARGFMPTLKRWLESGSHRLMEWEPDLSSQTSASQAGILLGDNTDIPAFRWWDKGEKRLMVSSQMSTARSIEQRLSSGKGLLIDNGASRWNVVSGDAPDCLCTYSTFGDRSRRAPAPTSPIPQSLHLRPRGQLVCCRRGPRTLAGVRQRPATSSRASIARANTPSSAPPRRPSCRKPASSC